MDSFVKILGVSVGLHESEAIKILSNQNIKVGRNNNCVHTDGLIKFLGEDMQINYSLNDSKIERISLHWFFNNKGKLNSREDDSRVYEVSQKVINYIHEMNVWRYNDNTTYDGKVRFVRTSFMDFFNKVEIVTQYKTETSAINYVGMRITDINTGAIEKNEFDFLRSKYILESSCVNIGKKEVNPNKASIKIHASNFWFKVAIIIVLLLIGLLYVQNNRYYYTDKGKIRVDKWKNEWTRLDNNGEYTNTLKNK